MSEAHVPKSTYVVSIQVEFEAADDDAIATITERLDRYIRRLGGRDLMIEHHDAGRALSTKDSTDELASRSGLLGGATPDGRAGTHHPAPEPSSTQHDQGGTNA